MLCALLLLLAGCADEKVVSGQSGQADFVLNEAAPEASFRWRAEMQVAAETPAGSWESELFFELRGQATSFAAVDAHIEVDADGFGPFDPPAAPITDREIRVLQVDLAPVWRGCEPGLPCVASGTARVRIEGEGGLVGGVLLRGRILGDSTLDGGRILLEVEPTD